MLVHQRVPKPTIFVLRATQIAAAQHRLLQLRRCGAKLVGCVVIDRVVQQELLYLRSGVKNLAISTGKSSTEKWWETCEKNLEIRWNSQDFLRTWKIRWIVWKCVGFFRREPGNSGYFDFLWVTRSFLDNFWPIFYGKSWGEDCINSRKE